jgi:hypothetical protein
MVRMELAVSTTAVDTKGIACEAKLAEKIMDAQDRRNCRWLVFRY